MIDASDGSVYIGDQVIFAHGATIKSNSEIGVQGTCPDGSIHCPSFVGSNTEVDGAIIEKDAMVQLMSRVAPGVVIPSGRKVLQGKNIENAAQVREKTLPVTGQIVLLCALQSKSITNSRFNTPNPRFA